MGDTSKCIGYTAEHTMQCRHTFMLEWIVLQSGAIKYSTSPTITRIVECPIEEVNSACYCYYYYYYYLQLIIPSMLGSVKRPWLSCSTTEVWYICLFSYLGLIHVVLEISVVHRSFSRQLLGKQAYPTLDYDHFIPNLRLSTNHRAVRYDVVWATDIVIEEIVYL
jgi:hypothetical protein